MDRRDGRDRQDASGSPASRTVRRIIAGNLSASFHTLFQIRSATGIGEGQAIGRAQQHDRAAEMHLFGQR